MGVTKGHFLGGLGERALRLLGQGFESLRLPDGEIGEDFPVDLDTGDLEAVHKSAIG